MPAKTGLKALQIWGALLLATAAVVGLTTGAGYLPGRGKASVATAVLVAAGALALAVGTFVRWRYTVGRRRR